MNIDQRYQSAKEMYAAIGVDTDAAIKALDKIPVSMHSGRATISLDLKEKPL